MISLDALYADLQNKDNQNPSCGDGDLPPNNMSGYPVCLAKNCEGGGVKAALVCVIFLFENEDQNLVRRTVYSAQSVSRPEARPAR
jgi:hypothetical protein